LSIVDSTAANCIVGGDNMGENGGNGDALVDLGVVGVDGTSDESVVMMGSELLLGYQIIGVYCYRKGNGYLFLRDEC
jgi:hypothetical protein